MPPQSRACADRATWRYCTGDACESPARLPPPWTLRKSPSCTNASLCDKLPTAPPSGSKIPTKPPPPPHFPRIHDASPAWQPARIASEPHGHAPRRYPAMHPHRGSAAQRGTGTAGHGGSKVGSAAFGMVWHMPGSVRSLTVVAKFAPAAGSRPRTASDTGSPCRHPPTNTPYPEISLPASKIPRDIPTPPVAPGRNTSPNPDPIDPGFSFSREC